MAYFLDNFPVSDNCADLVLTEEQEKYCRVVYKLDDEGGACFDALWNPEAKYSDEYVIVPLRSTGYTAEELAPRGTLADVKSFANVIGSGADPLIGGKWWIDLWSKEFNRGVRPNACSTDGAFYIWDGKSENRLKSVIFPEYTGSGWIYTDSPACCSNSFVGGHIIVNAKAADEVHEGGLVYIIPICNKHNIAITAQGLSFGTGYYMKLRGKTSALKLKGYLKGVSEYLERFKDEIRHE